jgi:osomolarity two-component system, sensor histidine kinase SLN1
VSSINRTPASAPATVPIQAPFAQMPVLVVDDDSLTRMLMKRLLTRLGCKVTTAENGEAALELITGSPKPTPQSEDAPPTPERSAGEDAGGAAVGGGAMHAHWTPESKYAVVFLDNQMPVLSGLEAVMKLRQAGRKDFVVGVTGMSPTLVFYCRHDVSRRIQATPCSVTRTITSRRERITCSRNRY